MTNNVVANLNKENEFLKSQSVALQRTTALLQSPETAVQKIVSQPLPAHVPLPTAFSCVSTPTGQATTHAQPRAADCTGAPVAAVGETAAHPYPLAPDPQQSTPPASKGVSMQSSSYFMRLRGEGEYFHQQAKCRCRAGRVAFRTRTRSKHRWVFGIH